MSGNAKGGIGKSVVFAHLYEYLTQENVRIAGFDPEDTGSTTFCSFCPSVQQISTSASSMDNVLNVLLSDDADVSMMDGLGAKHESLIQSWVDDLDMIEFCADNDIDITYLVVLEDTAEVVNYLNKLFGKLSTSQFTKVDWLLINPLYKGSGSKIWKGSEIQKVMFQPQYRDRVREITFPKFDQSDEKGGTSTHDYVFKKYSYTVNGKIYKYDYCTIPLLIGIGEQHPECIIGSNGKPDHMRMHRFKTYWKRIVEQFNDASDVILPKEEADLKTNPKKTANKK
jgi:hypothetical protein